RFRDQFPEARPDQIEYMDVSPKQVVSVATALIPFLEHDDANRALMGSNMQRQAVPLLEPEAPIVGTGMEERAARDSGQVVVARRDGVVISVTAERIRVEADSGELDEYRLQKFVRSNQGTCINQRPIVDLGQRVRAGEAIADSSSTSHGELALGRNVLVAVMSWEGGNYEDAIVISDRVVRDDLCTSIHIEKHEIQARDTKLVPEDITPEIPNFREESRKDVIAKILTADDMPFLPDGTAIDIILNPLGVPSRMNIGQILETHLGWALHAKGETAATAVFDGATEEQIRDELKGARHMVYGV